MPVKRTVPPKTERPRIVVDIDPETLAIDVKLTEAKIINARVLQRVIREITRTRKLELKKIIYKDRLAPEDYAEKFKED